MRGWGEIPRRIDIPPVKQESLYVRNVPSANELGHALEEDWHYRLIQVGAHGQGLEVRLAAVTYGREMVEMTRSCKHINYER